MSRIEMDVQDWRARTHLPDMLWQLYLQGLLHSGEEDVLERHLLICPCCQERLLESRCRQAA